MLRSLCGKLGRAGVPSLLSKTLPATKPLNLRSQGSRPWIQSTFNTGRNCPLGGQSSHSFRTTSTQNAVHPLIWVIMSRVAKFGGALMGRTMRRWWKKLPSEEKVLYAGKVRRSRSIIAGLFGATAFGSFVYHDRHIEVTPFTNRKRFIAFNHTQMKELGKITLDDILRKHEKNIIPKSSEKYKRVANVIQRLLDGNQDFPQVHDMEWNFYVIDDPRINAESSACGSTVVYSGLLDFCDNDDQLGIILGHELAHVILLHVAERLSSKHFMDLIFVIPFTAIWAYLPTDITAAILSALSSTFKKILMELPHSRFMEDEADQVGLVLAAKACFDIREAPVYWGKFFHEFEANAVFRSAWLSTHPCSDTRQARLEKMLPEAIEVRNKCQCPRLLLPGEISEDDETEIDFHFAI